MTAVYNSLNEVLDSVLIGVIGLNAGPTVSQTILSFPQTAGREIHDVCCIDLRRKGPTLWKVFTTHASAWVEGGEINISQGYELPRDGFLIYKLKKQRDALLATLNGRKEAFPYASIRGKAVMLVGNFSVLPVFLLLALEKIFLANGAKEVDFIEVPKATNA